jgi:hypothetical protein
MNAEIVIVFISDVDGVGVIIRRHSCTPIHVGMPRSFLSTRIKGHPL